VVQDIVFDFGTKPRLMSERGNAMLVASSIYEAAKYFELFQKTPFRGKCAVVTSYNPQAKDVTLEETGANTETDKQFLYNTYKALLKDVVAQTGKTQTETYEDEVKKLFQKQPANMRLLIVVDKLLTGFDAPPCTYLYIDKSMQDHGLFQAICRTNRLDGEDKEFGYIVDYKDLFKKVQGAMSVYTSELDDSDGGASPEVLLQDRLKAGREVWKRRARRLHCFVSPWNRRRVSWSTYTSSAATLRSRRIFRNASRAAWRFTKVPRL
jgi:type I restriction enzyme R subunit